MNIYLKFFFIVCVFILMAIAILFWQGYIRPNSPDLKDFAAHGIDVSHHQGKVDWPAVPKDKVSFVYIKSTEGGDWKDTRFQENWNGARNAGLKTGAYHFFTLCRDGKTQAQNFIESAPQDASALAPAIDLEYVGNCAARPTRDEFKKELDNFLSVIVSHYGIKPVLYTTKQFYKDYLAGTDYASYPLWLRDVWSKPDAKDYPNMVYWQYADRGRLTGINGPVDWNVQLKTK